MMCMNAVNNRVEANNAEAMGEVWDDVSGQSLDAKQVKQEFLAER